MSDLTDLNRPTQSTTNGFVEPAVKSPVDGKVKPVDSGNPLPTEPLGIPTIPHNLPATATSANTALTTTCRRASIYARNGDIRYMVGTTPQTASATSHFIASGERLDIALPPNANIAVIRDGSTDGILCVSELA